MKKTTILAVAGIWLVTGAASAYGQAGMQEELNNLRNKVNALEQKLGAGGNNSTASMMPAAGRAFEAGAGVQGPLSFFQVGMRLPEVKENMFMGIHLKYLSCLNYVTFIDPGDNNSYISFHPVAIGGVFSIGGYSPVVREFIKVYGGVDLFIGTSSTPYDDLVYNTGNLIGDNVTFIISGYFGMELFTNEKTSIFMDAGGGFKAISGDENNMYVSASSWIGSGFNFRMGVRFYRLKKSGE